MERCCSQSKTKEGLSQEKELTPDHQQPIKLTLRKRKSSDTPLRRSARLKAKRDHTTKDEEPLDLPTTSYHLQNATGSASAPDILCSSAGHRRAKRTSKSFVEEELSSRKKSLRSQKVSEEVATQSDSQEQASVAETTVKRFKKKRKVVKETESAVDLNKPKLKVPKTGSVDDILLSSDERETSQKKGKGKKHRSSKTKVIHKSVIQYNMSKEKDKSSDSLPSSQEDGSKNDESAEGLEEGGEIDPFIAMMNEEQKRLQMILEARGLPPHLLGSLGGRVPQIFQKHMSSSNNTKAHQLLEGLQCVQDESIQLQSCIEIGKLLVMGNEDTLGGFPVKETVPALVQLLTMEHNFDMMMNACRALTYMMEALPRSTVVVADAIPILLNKLQEIECMDVAEQALSALEIVSRKHSKAILQAGGVNACLLYLDFFSLAPQRSSLNIVANCCLSVNAGQFELVADSIPILTNRLQSQDKKSVESCCLAFSRLVESFTNHPKILEEIASHGLLQNIQSLLVMSPPVISSGMFVMIIRMLSVMCLSCPCLAVDLLKLDFSATLKVLLVGSEDISLDNIEINSRSSNEVFEIASLICQLMPPLPTTGIFEVDKLMTLKHHGPTSVRWEWQNDEGAWVPYSRLENRIIEASHMAGEEEAMIDVSGRNYIIEFGAMQQINEETGNVRSVRRSTNDKNGEGGNGDNKDDNSDKGVNDPRGVALNDASLCSNFLHSLFAVLYEVFSHMAIPSVRYKCLKALLKMINCATSDVLVDVLRDISVSSYIATMLKSSDYRVVVGAIQMAVVLVEKLPDIFITYFHREGVIHSMEVLKTIPLKSVVTPKKEEQPSKSEEVPIPPPPVIPTLVPTINPVPPVMNTPLAATPTPPTQPPSESGASSTGDSPSTARRFVDMFRRSRRQLKKSLSRSRSEDTQDVSPPRSGRPLPTMPLLPPTPISITSIPPHPAGISVGLLRGVTRVPTTTEDVPLVKEKIREWIQKEASLFVEKCSLSNTVDLSVLNSLQAITDKLSPSNPACLEAMNELGVLLGNANTSISSFEFLHCGTPDKMTSVLSDEDPAYPVSLNKRLKHFLHIFMGLPASDAELASWTPQERPGLVYLLQKVHGCLNHIEQLPVRVHDMPGKKGSQAMKFFNSHHIKCRLELHPSAEGLQKWKGDPVKINPLATLHAVERHLIARDVLKPDNGNDEDMDRSDEDSDTDDMLHTVSTAPPSGSPQLEFFINNHPIPHSMTIFQAVKQYDSTATSDTEELSALGHPEIWIKTHTLQYRRIKPGESFVRPQRSFSLPATPVASGSSSVGTRPRRTVSKTPVPVKEGMRITRSMSKDKQQAEKDATIGGVARNDSGPMEASEPIPPPTQISPLLRAIYKSKNMNLTINDPSLVLIKLIKIIFGLNSHWNDLYNGASGNSIIPLTEFINHKLTAKVSRQMQDPLNIMTGNFPEWIKELSLQCPFLFPFECRQVIFAVTAFDRDRALLKLQEQQADGSNERSERILPKLEKKKRCVSRDGLLQQAERIMEEMASNRSILEVHYQDEVGIGLGPTLEFYTLVSREMQLADLHMWRGDPCPLPGVASQGASDMSVGVTQYVYSPVGLFPAPLGTETSFSVVEEICGKFRFFGRFMAKAIVDSRMLDIPLSEAFYKWMLGCEDSFTAQDLQYVDPIVAQSFAQLADVAVKKHQLKNDPLLTGKALQVGIESLTLEGGGSIEELELDFTLPGYPYIELKPGGKDIPVTIHNIDEYLKLVLEWTLTRGVSRQMEAFREGFNSVFSISSLQHFYSHEMDTFLCGANTDKWNIKDLFEHCKPDHGYTPDSQAIKFLYEVLSSYTSVEQRQFIQFVTGSPRLPVGGFKALNPPLTIVRKTAEVGQYQNTDVFLPSVMTCVNYLKLPNYSSIEIMREKLSIALQEGKQSFHLS